MLNFSKVSKIFGSNTAVKDIDFTVDEHEFVLITGPSGAGKSTLMKLLIKEYIPTTGDIFYLGNPLAKVRGSKIASHRRQVGVVFQDYKLLNEYNIWENIALPLLIANKKQSEIEHRVTDLLKLVKLTDKAFMFPSQLSGGEAQRISIARALATGPKLIFADEPTGNLDPKTTLEIIALLNKINELGTTILLASHDQVVLEALAKIRQIRLDKGQLVEDTKSKSFAKSKKMTTATKPEDKLKDKPESRSEDKLKDKLESKPEEIEKTADSIAKATPPATPKNTPKTRLELSFAKLGQLFKRKKQS